MVTAIEHHERCVAYTGAAEKLRYGVQMLREQVEWRILRPWQDLLWNPLTVGVVVLRTRL